MNRLILHRQQRRIRRPPVSRSPSQEISEELQEAALQATAVLPEQSLALVQIFLNAAIASILYSRQILKHDSGVFSERCVADLLSVSGAATYKDFLGLETRAEEIRSQTFKVLVEGRSDRADQILTLLVRFRSLV
jgi:HORMA domain